MTHDTVTPNSDAPSQQPKRAREIPVVRFDWAVKHFLRNKANFDVLEGFLSELLHTDVIIEELLESEATPEDEKTKLNQVDVLAKTDQGKVIIEVQVEREYDYLSRILFGASKAIVDYMARGDRYYNVQKVISVSVLYFDLGTGADYIYKGQTEFRGIHTRDVLGLSDKEQQIYQHAVKTPAEIFSEYYLIKVNQFRNSIQDKLDEWMYFFKNAAVKSEFTAKGIQSAADKLAVIQMSTVEKSAYDRHMKDLSYESSMLDGYYAVGKIEGRVEGEAIGIQKGEAIGLEKGKQEEKINTARKLKTMGLSIQQICEITGVDETEVKSS